MIGRLGRSLGVHLLLASQRLDEGRIHQVEATCRTGSALRTFSSMESRSVHRRRADAYELPSAAGQRLPEGGHHQPGPVQGRLCLRAVHRQGLGPGNGRHGMRRRGLGRGCRSATRHLPLPEPAERRRNRTRQPPDDVAAGTQSPESLLEVLLTGSPTPARPPARCGCRRWTESPSLDPLLPGIVPDPVRGMSATTTRSLGACGCRSAWWTGRYDQLRELAGRRPLRGRRPRRRRRSPADRQVHPAAQPDPVARPDAHPGGSPVLLPGLRRRRSSSPSRGCRTSARSPPASNATGCCVPSRRSASCSRQREDEFTSHGLDSMACLPRGAGHGRDRRPVRRRLPGGRRLGHAAAGLQDLEAGQRDRRAGCRSACTSLVPRCAGRSSAPGCATCWAPSSNCGWATRWSPRWALGTRRSPAPARPRSHRGRPPLPVRAAPARRLVGHRRLTERHQVGRGGGRDILDAAARRAGVRLLPTRLPVPDHPVPDGDSGLSRPGTSSAWHRSGTTSRALRT